MKEILIKYKMDVLLESDLLLKTKGQPINTYANGVHTYNFDMENLYSAVEECYGRLGFVSGRVKFEEGDEGCRICGSRDFGEEVLKIVVNITSGYYDTYMPEHSRYLLKETKWEGKNVASHICGYIGCDGDDGVWKYKNVVLNNVVYACRREGERFWKMYYDAVNALYDDMSNKVREMSIKHGYGDIYERKAVPVVEVCSMAEFNEMIKGKNRKDFRHIFVLIFGDEDKPDDPEEMRNFYYKVPDIKYDELEEYGYTYEDFWPNAEIIAKVIMNDSFINKVVCVSENGKSRAAGCAAAISDYFLRDGVRWFADEKYTPNKLIYRKMKEALENVYKALRKK